MCSLEVFGISDKKDTVKRINNEDFKVQLKQQDKSCSTRLP